MRKLIYILLFFISYHSIAQINPTNGTVSNKSYAPAQAVTTDFRSWYYDQVNFIMRDYNGTAEVLSYLNLSKYRSGHFPIYVHSGGSLGSNGVWTGGSTLVYWFKDGTADGNLVRWYTDSLTTTPKVDTVYRKNDSTIGFTINQGPERTFIIRGTAAGGINSLSLNVPSSIFNNPVNFSNGGGGAWTGSMTLVNQNPSSFFAGPSSGGGAQPTFRQMVVADLPSGIPNANLQNSAINFSIGSSGSSPNWTTASVPLGGSAVLNLPTTSGLNTGVVMPTQFNFWSNKVDSTIMSNDSVYEYRNNTRYFRYIVVGGGGGGISSLNGLTGSVQTFAMGTSGTDFNISSSGTVHTFNIPTASASNRGLLATTDWSNFNSKEPGITASNTVKQYWNGYKQFVTFNTDSINEGATNLFFSNARARSAISLTTTGTSGAATYNSSTGVLNIPNYAAGSGTVTSVAVTVPSTLLTISGTPITTNGTFTFGLATSGANTVYGNHTGSTATPTFGKVVLADQATNTANYIQGWDGSGNPTALPPDTLFVKNRVSGTGVQLGNISSDTLYLNNLVAGANITLTHNADSSITIAATGGGGGGITSLNGLTGATQTFATGISGTDFGISSVGTTHTFNLPIASATNTGKISNTDWSNFNGKQAALSGTGYLFQTGSSSSYINGSATNLIGFNASGSSSAVVLGTNLSMTGNTLNATGGVPALNAGHIFMGNASNVAVDTSFVSDITTFPEIRQWVPGKGKGGSTDTLSGYPWGAVDTAYAPYNTVGNRLPEFNGGVLFNSIAGDSLQILGPRGVFIGNSLVAGHPWRFSREETGVLSYPDTIGQWTWRLSQSTHYPWINAGWGGQTTAQMRVRFLRDVLGFNAPNPYGSFSVALTNPATFVLIEGGINDESLTNPIRPVDSCKADILWMISVCQQYGIPCAVINLVGDGSARNTSMGRAELTAIQQLNDWEASGVLGVPVFDLNKYWNSSSQTGWPFVRDNTTFSSIVNAGDQIHLTQTGYDSTAKEMVRVLKIPILTKIAFLTAQDATHPLTNYRKPTKISVTGYPTGLTPGSRTVFQLPTTGAFDTVAVTTVIPDTAYFRIDSSANIFGGSTVTGFGGIRFFLDNNPNGNVIFSKKPQSSANIRTSDLQSTGLNIQTGNNNTTNVIAIKAANGFSTFNLTASQNGGAMLFNNGTNAAAPSWPWGGVPTLGMYGSGGISQQSGMTNTLGPTEIGVLTIGSSNAGNPISGIGFGMVGVAPTYGIWNRYDGGYGNTDGWVWDNQFKNVNQQAGTAGQNNALKIIYSQGNFIQQRDTLNWLTGIPTINNTITKFGNVMRFINFEPTVTSLGGNEFRFLRNTMGDVVLHTAGESGGRTAIGTNTPAGSARFDVTSTTRGAMLPRMTQSQRDSIRYISAISMTGGSWTAEPNATISGGSGAGARVSTTVSGGNVFFTIVDPGYGYGTSIPSVTLTGGTGSGGIITVTTHGADSGLVIFNTTSGTLQFYNGTAWIDCGGSSGYTTVQNNASSITARSRINLPSGSGLTFTDNSGNTSSDLTITSFPSSATATTQLFRDSSKKAATTEYVDQATKGAAGSYSVSAGTNVASVTAGFMRYTVVDSIVTVNVRGAWDVTTAGSISTINVTIPVTCSSYLSSREGSYMGSGTWYSAGTSDIVPIGALMTNSTTVQLFCKPPVTTSTSFSATFMYHQ